MLVAYESLNESFNFKESFSHFNFQPWCFIKCFIPTMKNHLTRFLLYSWALVLYLQVSKDTYNSWPNKNIKECYPQPYVCSCWAVQHPYVVRLGVLLPLHLGTVGSECCWHTQNIPWCTSRGSALHEVLKCNCCHSESWLCGHSLVVKSRLEAWIQLSCPGNRVFSGPQQTACKGHGFGCHRLWLYLRVMPLKI